MMAELLSGPLRERANLRCRNCGGAQTWSGCMSWPDLNC